MSSSSFVFLLMIVRVSTQSITDQFTHANESIDPSITHNSLDENYSASDADVFDEKSCLDEELDIEFKIIEAMVSESAGYSKQILPSKNGTDVLLEIHISDIPQISEIGSYFELDLFYSEIWEDKRLAYERLRTTSSRCVKNMTLDVDYLQRIWQPNVCIVNSRSASIHQSPTENVFLILYPNGKLWKNCRMLIRAPCEIELHDFPFDTQRCSLLFESYSYNTQKVRLHWLENPIVIMRPLQLADFHMVFNGTYSHGLEYPNGHWDQLNATFVFQRRSGFFIWQAFVPSYMTVAVAYITFWMDPKELCTRATLAISAFLAICLQFGNVQQNQPRVSYIKAMDVWMLASILFMFGSLVELAIISYLARLQEKLMTDQRKGSTVSPKTSLRGLRQKGYTQRKISRENGFEWQLLSEREQNRVSRENGVLPSSSSNPSTVNRSSNFDENGATIRGLAEGSGRLATNWWPMQFSNSNEKNPKRRRRRTAPFTADQVDKFFLCLYPPAFLAFNIFYWCYYLPRGHVMN